MGQLLDAGFKHDIYTGMRTLFNEALNNKDYAAISAPLIEEVASTNLAEDYDWLLDNFGLREWADEKHVKVMKGKGLTITNKPYEDTFALQTRILKTAGGAARYAPRTRMLARGANRFIDQLTFATLRAGFTTNGVDGVPFFSASHPILGSTYSNYGGGAGNAWYMFDTTIIKPVIFQWLQRPTPVESDKDEFDKGVIYFGVEADAGAGLSLWQAAFASKDTLNDTNFNAAIEAMMGVPVDGDAPGVGDKNPLGVMPNLLVVGRSNRAAAQAILEAQLKANGASNTNYRAVQLMISPHLD